MGHMNALEISQNLKKNMTIREASGFWDEHEFGEFEDVQEVHDVQFKLRKKKYVGLDPDLYEIIRRKAAALKPQRKMLFGSLLSEGQASERSLGCAVFWACLLSSGLGGQTCALSRIKAYHPPLKGGRGDCGRR